MNVQRAISLGLAAALLLAGAWPVHSPAAVADANGDQQVDVLDIQYVVAKVLAGGEAPLEADVNGDGRVDILDFQYILDEAAKEEGASEAPDPPQTPHAVTAASTILTAPIVARLDTQSTPEPGATAPGHPVATEAAPPPLRYLRNAPTHAPPALG